MASSKGFEQVVDLLLRAGANPDVRAYRGNTPLHLAAVKGHKAAAKLLLAFGADDIKTNRDGKTAKDLAREHGFADILDESLFVTKTEATKTERLPEPKLESRYQDICQSFDVRVELVWSDKKIAISKSVYSFIYQDSQEFWKRAKRELIGEMTDSGSNIDRWIHLPANNVRTTPTFNSKRTNRTSQKRWVQVRTHSKEPKH